MRLATTQQVGEFLGVSRWHPVLLFDDGRLPHPIDELTAEGQDCGLGN